MDVLKAAEWLSHLESGFNRLKGFTSYFTASKTESSGMQADKAGKGVTDEVLFAEAVTSAVNVLAQEDAYDLGSATAKVHAVTEIISKLDLDDAIAIRLIIGHSQEKVTKTETRAALEVSNSVNKKNDDSKEKNDTTISEVSNTRGREIIIYCVRLLDAKEETDVENFFLGLLAENRQKQKTLDGFEKVVVGISESLDAYGQDKSEITNRRINLPLWKRMMPLSFLFFKQREEEELASPSLSTNTNLSTTTQPENQNDN